MEGHIIRALGFLSLKIQFPFLASGAGFFQRDTCRLQHDGAYVSCRMRADRDAPHTGDTLFLSVLLGSFRSIACTGHCRAHTPHSVQSLEVFGTIPPPLLLLYPPGKFPELFLILLIRSSSGILADNGMLCNGGYCSYDTAVCPLCGILSSTRVSSYARLPYTHTKMAFAPFPFIMRRRFTTGPGTRPP